MTSIKYPYGNVLLRNLQWDYPIISHGEGVYLWDQSGRKYIDSSGGAFVNCLGHGHQKLIERICRQMEQVAYVNGQFFTSTVLEEYAQKICAKAPKNLDKVALFGSGSEAVEAALKFCRQYFMELGKGHKRKIVARSPGYHGNTMMALSASARPSYRKYFSPYLIEIPMAETPYEYRCPVNYQEEGADYYFSKIKETIEAEGEDTVMAIIVEPITASSCGVNEAPKGYFSKLRKYCDEKNILIVADEVACGAGRSGQYFASDQVGLVPDLIVMGKSINAGYIPCSAVLYPSRLVELFAKNSVNYMHAQTFMQSPMYAACALAVLDCVDELNLVEKVRESGRRLLLQMRESLAKHPNVGFVGGSGYLLSVELVKDQMTKECFEREKQVIEKFVEFSFSQGLLLWANKGHTPEAKGDLFVLAPPFTLTQEQSDEMLDLTHHCITEFFKKL